MKKISVIVPVYNVEKYLRKCFDSLVNQTLKDIEIIIINDGSPDNSKEIIDEYAKKYPKMIKALHKENGGLGDARNDGVKMSKGEYIAFVDSDDFVEIDMFEKLYSQAIKDKADLVICGYNVYNEDYKLLYSTPSIDDSVSDNRMINIVLGDNAVWNRLYKRELIVDNKMKFRTRVWYEDIDYKINVLLHSKKISTIKDGLYNYLVRQGSIMNNSNIEKNLEILAAFDQILEYCKLAKKTKKYSAEIEYLAIQHILIAGITRIINASGEKELKKEVIGKLENYMNDKFPNYKNNKYIQKLPRNKKIIYYLINKKMYALVRLIFKIKR